MSARTLLALLALTACSPGKPHLTAEGRAWVPLHPTTREPAVAALVLEHGMSGADYPEGEDHPLAVGLWADGTVIASEAGGGEHGHPYRTAKIGAQASERLRSSLRGLMLEREGKLVSFDILDSSEEVLFVRDGERVWRMSSCIDLFESNPKLMAFSHGIGVREELSGLSPDDPEERELRDFREAWTNAKHLLLSAASSDGSALESSRLEFAAMGSKSR